MDKGHIRQIGTPVEIYSRPRNHFVADFIGRANFIEARAARIGEDGVEIPLGGISRVYPSWERDIKAGDQVYIVIRPEGLRLSPGKQEDTFCRATVSQAVYLGATMEYELSSEDRKEHILAVSHNPILEGFYKEGDTLSVSFDPLSAHVIRNRERA
ncbi:MAG: TOBE domain-containing protein [Treponema sp.]|nr:TOBE domain-containing protein [Treponema sp.]